MRIHVRVRQRSDTVADEPQERILDAEHLHAVFGHRALGDCANHGVEPWAIAASGEYAYFSGLGHSLVFSGLSEDFIGHLAQPSLPLSSLANGVPRTGAPEQALKIFVEEPPGSAEPEGAGAPSGIEGEKSPNPTQG